MSDQPPSLPEEKVIIKNTFEIIEDTQEIRPVQSGYAPYYPPHPRKQGVYLSVWSLLVTFLLVILIAGGIIGAIIALGGRYQASSRPPILITVPAPTTATAAPPADLLNPETDSQPLALFTQVPAQSVQLSGPTMIPTITPTPTPAQIAVGATVLVVSQQGANVRNAPGTDGQVRFMAHNNQRFTVIDGPREANGLNWWHVQDPLNTSQNGWIAQTDGQQDLINVYMP